MFKELMSLLTRSWQSQPLTCKNCKSPRSCVQPHRVKEDYSLMGSSIMWLTASSSTDTHPGRTCTAWAPRWSPHIKSGPSGWWHSLGTVWPHSDTGLAGPGPTGGAPGIGQAEKELTLRRNCGAAAAYQGLQIFITRVSKVNPKLNI